MSNRKPGPKYSKDEFAERGQAIYERQILPKLDSSNSGRVVALDIESGEFAVDLDTLHAVRALRARLPDAQIWCVRVGHPAVERIG